MLRHAIVCGIVLAAVAAVPCFGGAPAEIRHLPDPLDILGWPGERPAAPATVGPAAEPRPVEMLRHEGTRFLVVPESRSQYGDYLRVSAGTGRTIVRLNGRVAVTLDPGEAWIFTPGWVKLRIEATDPVVMSFFVVPRH